MALNWDSIACKEKGCVVDHMRLSDSATGEILAWVHGPNDLGAYELINGVDQTVGCFIDSASAMQAAHKYVESVWSAKSDKAALATMLAAPSTGVSQLIDVLRKMGKMAGSPGPPGPPEGF